jgi:hypothetical protein
MLIFVIVVTSVFGGICLAALAVFLFQFHRSIQKLTAAAESVYGVMGPFSNQKLLPDLLAAMRKNAAVSVDIARGLDRLSQTVRSFNKMTFTEEAQAELAATPQALQEVIDSAFLAPTEEYMAVKEEQAELRKRGIETAPENMVEPDLAAMNGANV